jgi:hypothetical protein
MAANNKKLGYKGRLAEPMYSDDYFRPSGLLVEKSDEIARQEKERFLREFYDRIDLLFSHWNIDGKDWRSLAITLAIAHVPGLRSEPSQKRTGPAQIWDYTGYTELLAAVERLKKERDCSDSEACGVIARSPRFAKARWNKGKRRASHRSLLSRLSEARNPKYNMMAKILYDKDDPEFELYMRESLLRHFVIPPSQSSNG